MLSPSICTVLNYYSKEDWGRGHSCFTSCEDLVETFASPKVQCEGLLRLY